MHDVSIPAALIAGLVSFLSPCVLPLVPPYLVYLTGATIEHVASKETMQTSKRAVMAAALMFVLGFSTIFVTLGATASFIGRGLRDLRVAYLHKVTEIQTALGFNLPFPDDPFAFLAGIVIIIMGLHFLGLTRIGLLMREGRMPMPKPVGLWGAYAMGLAFAFGWTPCIGPILAAILSIAAAEATVTKGAGLLAVYSAGLGIPFLLAAFMIEQFSSLFARMKRHLAKVEHAMGILMVITGIGFLTGAVTSVSIWLLETFPALQNFG
ncbi:cytochrome c biogenesis CcdA family protein [Bradyrhizobium icense]|uniref:Cytochrome C biogenesis protein n=1 Tax=Bradyrhizobium icense TaxID=1274631 RepID=A0A1B1UMI6_9BRAD|nr:cytochrome c biogenesis CcdA family protein [Bradyrhizobium icense]ANW03971.1 cytochrome C biogenesis protein [Bradyrhizobium icense]